MHARKWVRRYIRYSTSETTFYNRQKRYQLDSRDYREEPNPLSQIDMAFKPDELKRLLVQAIICPNWFDDLQVSKNNLGYLENQTMGEKKH